MPSRLHRSRRLEPVRARHRDDARQRGRRCSELLRLPPARQAGVHTLSPFLRPVAKYLSGHAGQEASLAMAPASGAAPRRKIRWANTAALGRNSRKQGEC